MGCFVAIEGLDGIGKSTLVKQLVQVFTGHAMSTPGEALRDCSKVILDDFSDNELAKALFYAASVTSQGKKARTMADRGEWVFMDRYWASTVAYAKARGVTDDIEQLGNNLIQPDLTVLLHLDEQERLRRLRVRGATEEDKQTLSPCFRQCVLDELHARADIVLDISGQDLQSATQILEKLICEKVGCTARTC